MRHKLDRKLLLQLRGLEKSHQIHPHQWWAYLRVSMQLDPSTPILEIPKDPTTPVLTLNTSPPATPILHLTDEEDVQTQDTQDQFPNSNSGGHGRAQLDFS